MSTPTRRRTQDRGTQQAVVTGLVTALVGFTSSFAVVLAGLRAMGASADQAASGLTVLNLAMGVACIGFGLVTRMPITVAWSTPGAALLATAVAPEGGFSVAVGAFVVTGLLIAVTGLVPALTAVARSVPQPVASAMLAGVLLSLCVAPFRDLPDSPGAIGAVVGVWAVVLVLAPRWAVPATLAAALVAMSFSGAYADVAWSQASPTLQWVTPGFSWEAVLAVSLPLYLVTMTSQNIPGTAVMSSLGYEVPVRSTLVATGLGSSAAATFGGHAINLAAITAALPAGPEAGPDPSRRWIAAVTAGCGYLAFGIGAQAVVAVADAAPTGLFTALAGVALLGTFASSATAALADEDLRLPAAVTFVVAASGLTIAGIGSAFWAVVAGLALAGLIRVAGRSG